MEAQSAQTPISPAEAAQVTELMRKVAMEKVYMPAFVKLARQKGVEINTQDDLRAAINIVDSVNQIEKAASESGNALLKEASSSLQYAMALSDGPAQVGLSSALPGPDADDIKLIKAAAQDPLFINSALGALQLQNAAK